MICVEAYLSDDGSSPFQLWFDQLDPVAAARVTKAKIKLTLGQVGNLKPVDAGVFEYRIDYGPGYRIYLGWDGPTLIILLCGGDKRRQDRDIQEAKYLWQQYKKRKAARSPNLPNASRKGEGA